MGRKLSVLVGTLKDTASFSKAAAALSPASAAQLAVLRATPHHPADEPPNPRHIHALLSSGHGSRLSAASVAHALGARLRSTRDPAVALKCLLALHYLLNRGAFILRDQLPAVLLRHTASGRSPLVLAAFPHGASPAAWTLASWVRWYARILELLLSASVLLVSFPAAPRAPFSPPPVSVSDEDRLTGMLDRDVILELDVLVGVVEEMCRAPAMAAVGGSRLLTEAVKLVEEDRIAAEHEIQIRIREMRERVDSLGFADAMELICVLRRLEECRYRQSDRKPTVGDWFWAGVSDLVDRVEEVLLRKEEKGRKVKRERSIESARIEAIRVTTDSDAVRFADAVRFGSTRWRIP